MLDDGSTAQAESPGSQDKHPAAPAIAAILVAPGTYETVRCTMNHLRAQTAAAQMEVVIVAHSRQQLELDESELSCFHSWHVVENSDDNSMSAGYVAGIRQAHAPIVALTEDHSFPDTNWADLLIAAHRQPWAAVGPSVRNGNPETLLSWVDFYHAYSEWSPPVSSGPVRHLPGHNCSYKRDILLTFGSRLDILMEAESVLHRHLAAQGHRFFLESGTGTAHLNFTQWSSWTPLRFHIGRQFAATWAHAWSWHTRILFAAASPLFPWIRLWRIFNRVRRRQPFIFYMRLMPIIFLGLMIEWPGHMLGFLRGPGDSSAKVVKYELHRLE